VESPEDGGAIQGFALGVLMLDTRFPRFLGDVGNASSWPFPVRYRVVEGAVAERIVRSEPDPSLLPRFIDGARRLEVDGVAAITTSCGFLACFQRELAQAVGVPVVSSALLQVPLAARLIRADQRVAVLTVRPLLTDGHFAGAGWSSADIPVVVEALPDDALFPQLFTDRSLADADTEVLQREVIEAAVGLQRDHPDVGSIVLECTNFVPFSQGVRRATGLPVFDHYTLVMQAYLATTGVDFSADGDLRPRWTSRSRSV
jgi:hypothetical protein